MLYAAASAEPSRGWGGPIALVAAYLIFRVGQYVATRRGWIKIDNPSPPPALPTAERVKVQSTVGFTEPEPDEPEEGWWGRIVEVGGHRYRQVRQVMATGSHELPPDDDEPDEAGEDPAIDLALDDEPAPEGEEERGETIEEYIGRALGLGIPYNQIVKVLIDHYGVSRSTAKRRIGEARNAQQAKGGS